MQTSQNLAKTIAAFHKDLEFPKLIGFILTYPSHEVMIAKCTLPTQMYP